MNLSEEEGRVVSSFYEMPLQTISIFKRLLKNGEIFFCDKYLRVKKRNSFTVLYKSASDGRDQFGQILFFTIFQNKPGVVLKQLQLLDTPECFQPACVCPVKVINKLVVTSISNIKAKCVFVQVSSNVSYVFKFPCSLIVD